MLVQIAEHINLEDYYLFIYKLTIHYVSYYTLMKCTFLTLKTLQGFSVSSEQ